MKRDEYRYWSAERRFRDLVEQLVGLRMGGWSVPEVESALSSLGWKLRPVVSARLVDPARRTEQVDWELGWYPEGPRAGVATVVAAKSDPRQIVALSVNVSHGIAYDDEVEFVREAWGIVEGVCGARPTRWGGRGPWMLWQRPETSMAVGLDGSDVVVELRCAALADNARNEPPTVWEAAESSELLAREPRVVVTDWEDLRHRLRAALRALCHDTPKFPGQFIFHLESAVDEKRFVSVWNVGGDLTTEAFVHHPDLPDPNRLIELGWTPERGLWQRHFGNTISDEHADTAAELLVDALQTLGVDLADLKYTGTVSGRGQLVTIYLPELGLRRGEIVP
ncbi:TY-Chap domain-containing protein [Nocardia niwae]|uniref:TY-Chap domain-containing protein n=1 Tax=Nocardia niwae TaxID=626084 RepID=UPI0033D40A8D